MSIRRVLITFVLTLVAVFTIYHWPKGNSSDAQIENEELVLSEVSEEMVAEIAAEIAPEPTPIVESTIQGLQPVSDDRDLPQSVDRMSNLFDPYPPLLPIVETVTYSSHVSWITGRSAYLGDYAVHYQTPKHFISRSLQGVGNYLSEIVLKDDRFNVLRKDKKIEFHIVLDLSRRHMWLYYHDETENERLLLRDYPVAVGRLDPRRPSGCLTPTGVFALKKDGIVHREGAMGNFKNEQREMISVFGKRWIPFERELANCTGSCKGLGLHGVPWKKDLETGEYKEDRESVGNYVSGGCIRLYTEDIQELFAVVTSKPTYVHIVRDFQEAKLPGKEISLSN